jgi:signal transduction histidine kinase
VANRGKPIPPASREYIFEPFHRAAVGEDSPGHDLGLNLAREMALLHGGDVRLVRSDAEWMELVQDFAPDEAYEDVPIIWSAAYTTGVSVSGRIGKFEYAPS